MAARKKKTTKRKAKAKKATPRKKTAAKKTAAKRKTAARPRKTSARKPGSESSGIVYSDLRRSLDIVKRELSVRQVEARVQGAPSGKSRATSRK